MLRRRHAGVMRLRLAIAAGKVEKLISSTQKAFFLYGKPDRNRLIHTVHPFPVLCQYGGTLPSPLSSLLPRVTETREQNIKMSWERNATGSLRTSALCPERLRPQQCCHCPSQKGWNVAEGQLDPTATEQTKGLQMGQKEGWKMGL